MHPGETFSFFLSHGSQAFARTPRLSLQGSPAEPAGGENESHHLPLHERFQLFLFLFLFNEE